MYEGTIMKGRKFLTAGSIMVLVVGMLAGAAGSVLAVHQEGLFELDTSGTPVVGNANTVDSGAAGDDWATIYAGGGSAFADTFITDPVSSAENSFYTGGGSKDVRDIP